MKILVTGRDGQLGRSLAEASAGFPALDVRFVGRDDVDLAVPGSLAEAIRAAGPAAIINAAAYTAVDAAEDHEAAATQINGQAAGEGAIAAAQIGARFLHISTDYVFDGNLGRPYREDDPVAPINAYGRSKLEGERQVIIAGGRHTIVRTSWVVSPFGRNFVRTMLHLASSRDELRVVADQFGGPTSAPDLAVGLLDLLRRGVGEGEILHLTNSGGTSWADLARHVFACSAALGGPSAAVRSITTAEFPTRAPRPADSRLDTGKARDGAGIVMPEWQGSVEGIVRRLIEAGA